MIITKPFDGTDIIVLKEFATKEETETLGTYLLSMYEAGKNKDDSLKRTDLADDSFKIINDLEKRYIDFAKQNLRFEVEPHFSTLINYVYWETGKKMLPHYDNVAGEHVSPVMYGCVYYINDDFSGGEIYYPNFGAEYVPVAGEMIIHPGSREYSHGVKEITSGTRISAASFITKKDASEDIFKFEY